LASRTQSKLDSVTTSIKDAYPKANVHTVILDLTSQESVERATAQVAEVTDSLDIIINNAGIMTLKKEVTAEGIEAQFGANHIGHFLLTNLLMPQILTAAKLNAPGSTRIVNLTSLGHRLSPVRFHDFNFEGKPIPSEEEHPPLPPAFSKGADGPYNGYVSYGQAKTANILFSVQLTKLLKQQGVVSYAVHPGCEFLASNYHTGVELLMHCSNLDRARQESRCRWRGSNSSHEPVLEESRSGCLNNISGCARSRARWHVYFPIS